jgi:HEAT repeat protein
MVEHQVAHFIRVLRETPAPAWKQYQAAKGLGTLCRRFPDPIGGWRSAVIEVLTAELANPHFQVRWAAMVALESAAPAEGVTVRRAVVERIAPLLGDPTWLVRSRVLIAIGRIDPEPARDRLLALLGERGFRARSAEALGGMRTADPEVVAALCALLPSSEAGGAAALALGRLAEVVGDDAVAAAVRPWLLHPSSGARASSLRALVVLRAPGWPELCADAMADPQVEVRVRAVAGLVAAAREAGARPDAGARLWWRRLESAAADGHWRVRTALADSLAQVDGGDALLLGLLADSNGSVRSAARWALVRRLDTVERVRDGLGVDAIRVDAVGRLGDVGDRSDVDRLRALLDHPDGRVRRQALRALPRLVSRLPRRTRGLRRWLAGPIRARFENDPDPGVRAVAEKALADLSILA